MRAMTGPMTHAEYFTTRRFWVLDGLRAIAILL
jgi:hypothetical protein